MLKLTNRNGELLYHGKVVWHKDVLPWEIPEYAKTLWFKVSLIPGGISYEVFATTTVISCRTKRFPLPLALEILKKIEMYVETTVYLELWYA